MGIPGLILPRYETPDPPGVVGTYGDRAIAWAKRELNLTPGPWQEYVIRKMLRYDREGDLIAREALISTGRQNGKSVIVRIVVGWMLDEGRELVPFRDWTTVLAAAHDAKQARIIYEGVYADLASIPRLVQGAKGGRFGRTVKLTELFGIRVGSLNFDTVTSQPGSARGKSAGLIAWDEMLTQHDWDMYKALGPTQSAQRSPLMIFTSTAGDPDSVVLRDRFDRLVGQSSGALKPDPHFYGAWWQSQDPTPREDWEQIAQANPSLHDGRLSRDFIMGELAGPPELFTQERLNHWLDTRGASAVNLAQWAACRYPSPLLDAPGPFALAVDVQPDRERATVAVAGLRTDGRVGVEIAADLRSNPVANEAITAAVHRFPEPVDAIAYDRVSGWAAEARRDAEVTGLPYDELSSSAIVSAHMDVAEMIEQGRLAIDDPLVDAQVVNAVRKYVGTEGAYRFTRKDSTGPIDAFLAVVMAAHAVVFPRQSGGFW